MSQLLRFEGASPEEARDNARRAAGPEALIVRAGRERSGGVLGFFEKEIYVIEVDPDSVAAPPANAAASVPAGARGVLDAVADAVEDAFVAKPAPTPHRAPSIRQPRAVQPPVAPLAGVPARTGQAPPPSAFSALLEEAAAAVAAGRAGALEEPQPAVEPRQLPIPPADRASQPARVAVPAPAPPPLEADLQDATPEPGDPRRELLSALGLPPGLLPAPGAPLDTGLVEALRALPLAPRLPHGRDAVVLVAGPPQHLGLLASSIARRLGAGDDGIVAVPGRVKNLPAAAVTVAYARDAAAAVADRRIAQRPCVVAVEIRAGAALAYLLAQVATAVRADAAWAVLPARWSRSQVRELDLALRGVDALCLVELDAAEQPAALLGAGVPIATIDRRPATASMWAARLLDRCERQLIDDPLMLHATFAATGAAPERHLAAPTACHAFEAEPACRTGDAHPAGKDHSPAAAGSPEAARTPGLFATTTAGALAGAGR